MDEIEIVITEEGLAVWWAVPDLDEMAEALGREIYPTASRYCG